MKTILEAVPPESHRGEAGIEAVLEKVAAVHALSPLDGVNIPEIHEEPARSKKGERRRPFAPRVPPRELAGLIQQRLGIDCMINHVVVHHHSNQALLDWAEKTFEVYGVSDFVLVGGGRHAFAYPGPSVAQANTLLREQAAIPNLRIGNICIPSRQNEAERMQAKAQAGAHFFTTQILYEPTDFTKLLDAINTNNAAIEEVLLAFCPVRSQQNIRFLLWLGVEISDALEQWLTAAEGNVETRSLEQIKSTWQTIAEHQQIAGVRQPQLGINLAPIGPIPPATSADLAHSLAAVHARGNDTV
ncbi:MAG: mycobacterial-type methylenetetrahydrofolate reductase [Spiribacter sp.]|jgi:5,10-methylenetetrahydrofolate reductase|nr:mycobacterial-type methylenetetrahydrofolate reductase [Spiribacter sp.]MDR9489799.1 mycobacterial-type methylenetetrahydrofolate reductase [Spiribacter sp.]